MKSGLCGPQLCIRSDTASYESCDDLLCGEDGDQSGGDGGDNPYNNVVDHRHKGNRGKRKQWIGKQKKLSSTGCPHNFV